MQRICRSLHRAGYKVLLVGRKKKASLPLGDQPYDQKRLRCILQKGKWFYLEYNLRLFFFLLLRKAEILNAIDLDSILAVRLAGLFKKSKLVYDAHEYFTEVPEVVDRPTTKKIWEWVANKCIPAMDACYTVGAGLAEIFEKQYGIFFGVVRNVPLPVDGTVNPEEEGEKILLYQGALNEGRGLEATIEAMLLLPSEIKLWLAGEGDLSVSLRNQVKEAGLEERVCFLGYVLPEDLKRITPKAWIGLNLLENKGLSYYYSLANKAFDYVQAGLPSLQMDFPEYRALQEEYACFELLENLDPSLIADAVEKLQDEEYYLERVQNCQLAAIEWHWEKEEKKLLTIYENL
ncbi:MAG: glycosyltransferase family 4 protein [Bacteroidetes bacterium]|nr:glycosyltransferase family 4 protein [Bacteroidota bacterium]